MNTTDQMNKQVNAVRNDLDSLAKEARALMAATADVAAEKVAEARQRGQEFAGSLRNKALEGAKAADEAVRDHPYQAMGIALGVGAILGALVACRYSRNGD